MAMGQGVREDRFHRPSEGAGMSDTVKSDQGGVNERILAKEAKVDFRRVEAASLKMPTRFTSAEGKRFFVRLFNTLQLNTHFVSVIARTRLDHEDVGKVEATIRAQMESVTANLNQAIDGAEALFKAHGITSAASYDTVPMDVEVHVLSSISRRFLEVLVKFDQLMPLLQTLEIHEVITPQAVDKQRAALKRQVRNIANGARNFAVGLRRRMNALDSPEGGSATQVVADPKSELPAAPSAEPCAEPETRLTTAASDVPTNSTPTHAGVPVAAGQ
jgi:Transcriptional regulator AcaB